MYSVADRGRALKSLDNTTKYALIGIGPDLSQHSLEEKKNMRKIENVVALRNFAAVCYQRNRRRFVIISKCQRIRESFWNEHE